MLRSRRVRFFALAYAAVLVGLTPVTAAAQEAPPTTVPGPPATVPAPPPFPLPMDSGAKLVAQRDQAKLDILFGEAELTKAVAARDDLHARHDNLVALLARHEASRRQAIRDIDASRARLSAAAADAYVHASSDGATVIKTVAEAQETLDLQRDLHLIEAYGRREIDVYDALVEDKQSIEGQIDLVTRRRDEMKVKWDDARERADGVALALLGAHDRLTEAEEGLAEFVELAEWASSPIQGPNFLTAYELAEFVKASGTTQNITVSIEELAQYYIEESEKLGIRGDVAFAQSILETGFFGFAGSMVEPEDNNFAGIGACDSCTRGFRFKTAREGVRAQMQLLRVYVDADVTIDSLPDPLLLPGTLRLGFRGKVKSWWDLTGTWATAVDYGIRVYGLYTGIVAFAETLPPPPEPPPAEPPPAETQPAEPVPSPAG